MKVVVNEAAARDLDDIFNWISKDNPRAAAAMVRRVSARINQLGLPGLSQIGRPGFDEGTRELVEPPYIVVYSIDQQADEIEVLAIVHGARDRSREA